MYREINTHYESLLPRFLYRDKKIGFEFSDKRIIYWIYSYVELYQVDISALNTKLEAVTKF